MHTQIRFNYYIFQGSNAEFLLQDKQLFTALGSNFAMPSGQVSHDQTSLLEYL